MHQKVLDLRARLAESMTLQGVRSMRVRTLRTRLEGMKFNPDEARDSHGRWTDDGSGPKDWVGDFATQIQDEFPGIKLHIHKSAAGHVVLSQIVVPSRSQGVGTKVMQRLTDLADAHGDTITLTPSSDFGGNKTRLEGFYKRFGFVPNKGRNKDYEISEGMYRLPKS